MLDGPSPLERKNDSVQVAEDMTFQERTWIIQRFGWCAMALLILAALAGLFATGPLSSAKAHDPGGLLRVEYERFLRHRAPNTMRLHLSAQAVTGNVVSIRINNALADGIQAEKITPQPQETKATAAGVEYTFAVAEPSQPASVRFSLNSDGVGPLEAG